MFKIETGVNMVHVPHKTVPSAVTDLIAGQVQMMFVVSTAAVPQIQAGRIRGLGVTSLQRSPVVPDLATLDEAGVRKFEATAWYGFLAPAGTPQAILTRLHEEVTQVLKVPEIGQRLASLGLEPIGNSPQAFGDFIKAELAKWAKYAKASGAKVD
jgi:tripartite-type tricarboxylate transporter receptor subunit TctC